MVKNLPANVGDMGLSPTLGRFPAKGNSNSLGNFSWEIPWQATVHGVIKSQA